jgi:sialate O-acetylesterase
MVKHSVSDFPLSDVQGTWTACTPTTAANFSAVAYFFGREISEREGIPVGLVESTWGGTPAQPWVSLRALGAADFSAALRDGATAMQSKALFEEIQSNLAVENEARSAEGKPSLTFPYKDYSFQAPGVLFNGMIAPLTSYSIKGVIWYQGESDADPERAADYSRLFSILIRDWRDRWREGNFPFLYVQISSTMAPQGDWFRVRDAQRRVLDLQNTAMAVTLDVGDPNNAHAPDKQTVGGRLALAAFATVYGEKAGALSPEFMEVTTEGSAVRVWFSHARGLHAGTTGLGGFEVAGEDQQFVPADARIEEIGETGTVVVSAPTIPEPRYVRYGWSEMVTNYLYNSAGLPLGTFITEVSR